MPIPFEINTRNLYLSEDEAEASIQRAFAIWQQSQALVSYTFMGRTDTTALGFDHRQVVVFRSEGGTYGGPYASTYWWSIGQDIVDADIVIFDGSYHTYAGTSGCTGSGFYIEDVIGHEFGHLLGLLHSQDSSATMYAYGSYCSQSARTLAQDDITGIQALYPSSGPYNYPPTSQIMEPPNYQQALVLQPGTPVTLSGYADDREDGDLSDRMVWRSQIVTTPLGTGRPLTVTLPLGQHTITATVIDHAGVTKTSAPVFVTVIAPQPPMTVTVTAPLAGARVARNHDITMKATVSGGTAQRVEFLVDGVLTCTDTTPAYTCKWRVPQGAGIAYALTARAVDAAGVSGVATDVLHVTSK